MWWWQRLGRWSKLGRYRHKDNPHTIYHIWNDFVEYLYIQYKLWKKIAKSLIRRVGNADAHYGGNLVDGAGCSSFFGDVWLQSY